MQDQLPITQQIYVSSIIVDGTVELELIDTCFRADEFASVDVIAVLSIVNLLEAHPCLGALRRQLCVL